MMKFQIARCDAYHINEILSIQSEAFESMEHPEWLRENTKEMLLDCLGFPHVTVGAFSNSVMSGFAILFKGEKTDENLGLTLGFSGDELKSIANFKLVIVRPMFRGHSLQRILMTELERIAKDEDIKLLCTTVHPDNIASKISIEKSNYIFAKRTTKYGGLLRDIYYKSLE